ncbi:hypothetical protein H0H81_002560 [Sphagnurus paluster]|uniref:Uncharacterized protein n=1 Tax=Sphagnurus paluster TaxID=117069 RepID=A0A9P7GR19_9AGAR|nr:hypothetical protein H0H81_002560 [Sphagnurus paluster]
MLLLKSGGYRVKTPQVDEDFVKRQQATYAVACVEEEVNSILCLIAMPKLSASNILDPCCTSTCAREQVAEVESEDYTSATPISEARKPMEHARNDNKERAPTDASRGTQRCM